MIQATAPYASHPLHNTPPLPSRCIKSHPCMHACIRLKHTTQKHASYKSETVRRQRSKQAEGTCSMPPTCRQHSSDSMLESPIPPPPCPATLVILPQAAQTCPTLVTLFPRINEASLTHMQPCPCKGQWPSSPTIHTGTHGHQQLLIQHPKQLPDIHIPKHTHMQVA
jgi:hypothetical protein